MYKESKFIAIVVEQALWLDAVFRLGMAPDRAGYAAICHVLAALYAATATPTCCCTRMVVRRWLSLALSSWVTRDRTFETLGGTYKQRCRLVILATLRGRRCQNCRLVRLNDLDGLLLLLS